MRCANLTVAFHLAIETKGQRRVLNQRWATDKLQRDWQELMESTRATLQLLTIGLKSLAWAISF